MTIAQRLLLLISGASLSLLFVGGFGIWQLDRASARFDAVQQQTLPAVEALDRVRADIDNLRRFNYRYLVVDDDTARAAVEGDMHKADATLEKDLADFQGIVPNNADEQTLFDTDRKAIAGFRQARAGYMMTARGGDLAGARAILLNGGAVDVASGRVVAAIAQHAAFENQRAQQQRDANHAAFTQTLWLLSAVLASTLLLGGLLGARVYRVVAGALNAMTRTFERVGSSLDLSATLEVRRDDEFGAVARAFNQLLERVWGINKVSAISYHKHCYSPQPGIHSSGLLSPISPQTPASKVRSLFCKASSYTVP